MTYDLNKLRTMVEQATDLTSQAREASERDRDYYDGHQWTAEEIAVLNKRKQPIITINRVQRKIDAMVGIEQQGRVDPVAYPRTPQAEQAASVATEVLTFVDDNTRLDAKRSQAFETMIVEGYGGVEVAVEEKRGKYEIAINRLRWEEIFFDPHSREKDFSDAAYVGVMKWMTIDAALEMYAGTVEKDKLVEMLDQSMKNPQDGETYEDRPFETNSFRWSDRRQKRVRIAQMYYKKGGQWNLSIFCGGGEIMNDVSPYEDEDGKPCCPIVLMTGYIDRENRRYGVVRSMISMQDEVNHRRSKLLHQLNNRQTIGVKGAVDSVADMKRQMSQPDGHVEMNIEAFEDALRVGVKPFELVQNQDQTSGQFSLLQESKMEIDQLGPNASLLGQLSGDQSGRAIIAQQQAGFAELAPIYDSLRDWTIRVYRAIWERVRQYWTEERWIRVTGRDGRTNFIGLNVVQGFMPVIGMDGSQQLVPQMENAVAEMDVDIIIDEVQDYASLQHEEFEQLATLAQQGMPIPPMMLIEASTVRNKQEIIEALEQQQQQAGQQQQIAMQVEMQEKAVETDKTQSEAEKNRAQTWKTMIEGQREALGY